MKHSDPQALDTGFRAGFPQGRHPRGKPAAGFTLTELLVVLAVIAILAALLLPIISRALKGGQKTQDVANIRTASQAKTAYAQDHDDEIVAFDWNSRYQGYIYQIVPYLGGSGGPTWEEAMSTLRAFRSKAVPKQVQYNQGAPAWALPEYISTWTPGSSWNNIDPEYLKMNIINVPSDQIYAVIGFGTFDTTSGQDSNFTVPRTMPGGDRSQHIYFPYQGTTVASYFDGHTASLKPGIDLVQLSND